MDPRAAWARNKELAWVCGGSGRLTDQDEYTITWLGIGVPNEKDQYNGNTMDSGAEARLLRSSLFLPNSRIRPDGPIVIVANPLFTPCLGRCPRCVLIVEDVYKREARPQAGE